MTCNAVAPVTLREKAAGKFHGSWEFVGVSPKTLVQILCLGQPAFTLRSPDILTDIVSGCPESGCSRIVDRQQRNIRR